MIKEKPIIFRPEMVCALLRSDNPKTQTRRIIKKWKLHGHWRTIYHTAAIADWEMPHLLDSCPYLVGTRLWVKEAWGCMDEDSEDYLQTYRDEPWRGEVDPSKVILRYRADGEEQVVERWRNPMSLPRWAARLLLEVTAIRVQRVNEISVADVRAEGIPETWGDWQGLGPNGYENHLWDNLTAQEQFRLVWNAIHGKNPGCAFEDAPWVWVVDFRRIKP